MNITIPPTENHPMLPRPGDFIVFGEFSVFLVARTDGAFTPQNGGVKLIGLEDGNRYSDGSSLEETIHALEGEYGPMRIAKTADISFSF